MVASTVDQFSASQWMRKYHSRLNVGEKISLPPPDNWFVDVFYHQNQNGIQGCILQAHRQITPQHIVF